MNIIHSKMRKRLHVSSVEDIMQIKHGMFK